MRLIQSHSCTTLRCNINEPHCTHMYQHLCTFHPQPGPPGPATKKACAKENPRSSIGGWRWHMVAPERPQAVKKRGERQQEQEMSNVTWMKWWNLLKVVEIWWTSMNFGWTRNSFIGQWLKVAQPYFAVSGICWLSTVPISPISPIGPTSSKSSASGFTALPRRFSMSSPK